jgi:hypothetical protein
VSRRALLRSACGGAALFCAGRAAAAEVVKLTQAQAEYKDTATGDLTCVACALFIEPKYCTIIQGEVSPKGTCKFFVPVE